MLVPVRCMAAQRMAEWAPKGCHLDGDNEACTQYRMVLGMLTNLMSFHGCLFKHGKWMPNDAAKEAHHYLKEVAAYHYALCGLLKSVHGRDLFRVHDYFEHIAIDMLKFNWNPRFGRRYKDSGFMMQLNEVRRLHRHVKQHSKHNKMPKLRVFKTQHTLQNDPEDQRSCAPSGRWF